MDHVKKVENKFKNVGTILDNFEFEDENDGDKLDQKIQEANESQEGGPASQNLQNNDHYINGKAGYYQNPYSNYGRNSKGHVV